MGKPEALSHYSNIKCRKSELWLSQERGRVEEKQNKKIYGKEEWNKIGKRLKLKEITWDGKDRRKELREDRTKEGMVRVGLGKRNQTFGEKAVERGREHHFISKSGYRIHNSVATLF